MSSVCASPGSDELGHLNRFVLICKPEQSGKTFVMIQQIIKGITYPSCDKVVVNIIFCDNNLLLTRQTSTRVGADLARNLEIEDNGEIFLEFSSHSRTAYHNYNDVIGGIVRNINNVLCCTNRTRVDDTFEIIEGLQDNPETRKGRPFLQPYARQHHGKPRVNARRHHAHKRRKMDVQQMDTHQTMASKK